MSIINSLEWRYATKKFDPDRKVSNQDIDTLKRAIQLAPSSYGFQLYKVLIITDQTIKKNLVKHSYYQSQVRDCSHLFVFCSYKTVKPEHVDEFVTLMQEARTNDKEEGLKQKFQSAAKIKAYSIIAKADLGNRDPKDAQEWMKRQCYIALGNLMATCAEMRIDSCPFEGFKSEEYDRILGLTDRNLTSAVLCPVGYRSPEDHHQHRTKVRKSKERLFEEK